MKVISPTQTSRTGRKVNKSIKPWWVNNVNLAARSSPRRETAITKIRSGKSIKRMSTDKDNVAQSPESPFRVPLSPAAKKSPCPSRSPSPYRGPMTSPSPASPYSTCSSPGSPRSPMSPFSNAKTRVAKSIAIEGLIVEKRVRQCLFVVDNINECIHVLSCSGATVRCLMTNGWIWSA